MLMAPKYKRLLFGRIVPFALLLLFFNPEILHAQIIPLISGSITGQTPVDQGTTILIP